MTKVVNASSVISANVNELELARLRYLERLCQMEVPSKAALDIVSELVVARDRYEMVCRQLDNQVNRATALVQELKELRENHSA